jgi:hypothetical protein
MAKWYVNTRNLWDVNQFGHGNFPSPRGIFLDIYYCWKEAHIVLDGNCFPANVWRPPQMSYTPMCDYASFECKIFVGYLLAEA